MDGCEARELGIVDHHSLIVSACSAALLGVVGWLAQQWPPDALLTDGPFLEDPGPQGPVLVGRVSKVKDGDSLVVKLSSGSIEVRLHSADAPEHDQPWGREARTALERHLRGKDVSLEVVDQDHYGRLVAVVYLGAENVNGWLVTQGHAWAYRQYADDERYCVAEAQARAAGRGLWAESPTLHAPWEWRQSQRDGNSRFTDYSRETASDCIAALGERADSGPVEPVAAAAVPAGDRPSGDCRIKGNIGTTGRIYHLPGTAAYDRTTIDADLGERWFCSEEQARAAGWRPPRGP